MHKLWFCLGMVVAMSTASPATAMPFTSLPWRAVNDTVMGGVSQGRVVSDESVRFSGVLSLERNGGFASMRAPVAQGTFEGGSALRVRLRGDGRTYDLTLRRADVPLRAGSYRSPLRTSDVETEVLVPLSSFRPMSFGRPVPGAPSLDADLNQIDTIGVMLADGNPGPFSLEILDVSVVRTELPARGSRGPVTGLLRAAIKVGVPLYNGGEVAACRDAYAEALTTALEEAGLTPGEHALIHDALKMAATQGSAEGAWTLRHVIDSVLW